jgi:ABC-type transport system involved in multi-copper enzyme maturation permease subunit
MPIREKGYYNWEGQLKESHVKWLPIFLNGIVQVFNKKRSKLLFAFASMPFLIFLAGVYVATKPELKMLREIVQQIKTDTLLFYSFYTFGLLIFSMIVISVFAGSDLISGDMRFKSFTLYLSRPLSKMDYLMGKYSVVLFYLLLFTLVPGMLLIVAKLIFSGSFSVPILVFASSILFPIVTALFFSSLILMVSSLTTNSKFVVVMFFGIVLGSNIVAQIFKEVFKNDQFYLLSIEKNIMNFGSFLFNTKSGLEIAGWPSGLILIGLTALFMTILYFRIDKAEV